LDGANAPWEVALPHTALTERRQAAGFGVLSALLVAAYVVRTAMLG
jgi:hypothetical protein